MGASRNPVWVVTNVNEETSLYEHYNENIEINTLNTNDKMRNHILRYDVLKLEASFYDV